MLIDIPCVLYIDTEQHLPHAQAVQKCTLTLRFATCYPPKSGTVFWDDAGDLFAMAIGIREYQKLIARARANPYDYAVGTEEERAKMQEAADAERDQTP